MKPAKAPYGTACGAFVLQETTAKASIHGADRRKDTAKPMRNLFAGIAGKYDTMNRIMSLGLDLSWRRMAIRNVELPPGSMALDLACGTGDFTAELAKRLPETRIIGLDLTPEMTEIAKRKLHAAKNASFVTGDAQDLSTIEAGRCDLVVCAFGFRNFPDKARVLRECRRILAPKGKLVVLEIFRPGSKILGAAVNAWLAAVSWLFAFGSRKEYRYLRQSVAGTVSSAEFMDLAGQNGFSVSECRFLPPAATCVTLTAE